MGLSLAQLVPILTRAAWKAKLLLAAQGVGFVSRAGVGSGSLTASGVAAVAASVRVKFTTGGELGTALYKLSRDAGATWSTVATLPGSGTLALSGTGVTLQFAGGPAGSGESFTVGDTYALELTVPTLPVTAWQPGSTPLTLFGIFADALADVGRTMQSAVAGGLLRSSYGSWLELLANNFYNLQKQPGVVGQRTLRLTDVGGVGPATLSVGDLWVGTVGGLRWTNTTGGTLPLGGTLDLTFAAEAVGGKYNVGAGVITTFFTSFPGVSVGDPLGVATLLVAGQDAESDRALILRCQERWPSLAVAPPSAAYDLFAKTASANVTRTAVRANPTNPGQVQIIIGGAAGALGSTDINAVKAYVKLRLGTCLTVDVQSVSNVTQNIAATIYCYTGTTDAVTADITQNLTALFFGGSDTEGEQLPPVPISGTLYLNQIIEQLQTPVGVRNAVLTTPAPGGGDIVLTWPQVAVLGTIALTLVEVAQ